MATCSLLHNPRCSKSRAVKALLDERGVSADVRLYLEDPLDVAELRALMAKLGIDDPRAMTRTKEAAYTAAHGADLDADGLLRAIAAHPILLERPVLIRGDRAVIGRPPENVLELLDDAASGRS
jgi:arsenate reductase